MLKWVFLLLIMVFLAACGQKGDLYMPDEPFKQDQVKKPKKTGNQQ